MKFLFSFSVISWLSTTLFISPSLALDPIIVNRSLHTYCNDQRQCTPNDPLDPDFSSVVLESEPQVSQTFKPIQIGASNGQPIYQRQEINRVQGQLDPNKINDDSGNSITTEYLGKDLPDALTDPETLRTSFKNMTLQGTNSTTRSLSQKDHLFYLSQKALQIATFITGGQSSCIDEEVKTAKGNIKSSEIFAAIARLESSEVLKKRLSSGYFYYDTAANPQAYSQPPVALPADLRAAFNSLPHSFTLSNDEYITLLLRMEPTCGQTGTGSKVRQCELSNGQEVNCREVARTIPRAGTVAGPKTFNQYLPANFKRSNSDLNQASTAKPSTDRPNHISLLAVVLKFFGVVTDSPQTYTAQAPKVKQFLSTEAATGYQDQMDSVRTMFPQKTQQKKGLNNLPASGVDSQNTIKDPGKGNGDLIKQFARQMHPASWYRN